MCGTYPYEVGRLVLRSGGSELGNEADAVLGLRGVFFVSHCGREDGVGFDDVHLMAGRAQNFRQSGDTGDSMRQNYSRRVANLLQQRVKALA